MSAPQPIRPKAPLLIGLIGLIAVATIIVPVAALGLRVPWERIGDYLARDEIRDMLLISVAAAFNPWSLRSCWVWGWPCGCSSSAAVAP